MTTARAILVASLVMAAGSAIRLSGAADQRSVALRREAYQATYNLDFDRADDLFRQAIAADPADPEAYRGAAAAIWQRVLFLRGTLLVDDYRGHIRSSATEPIPPVPADLSAAFHRNLERAVTEAEKAVNRHYRDAAPHCDLGAALALHVWFSSSIEGKTWTPGRKARRAFSEYELAHELDPTRKDVGLVLGTYRYMVSRLPKVVRLLAGIIGFRGGKEEGIRLLEEAAAAPGDLQAEAQFRLVLLYTSEGRHDDAVEAIRTMERSFPRNRLLMLEEASALLRNRRAGEAEAVLDEGLARLARETRPLMPGEEGRWHYKRGMARVLAGKLDAAEEDLKLALGANGVRDWVVARIRIEFGKVADLRGDRARAEDEYRRALAIATRLGDDRAASEATRLLAQPFERQPHESAESGS